MSVVVSSLVSRLLMPINLPAVVTKGCNLPCQLKSDEIKKYAFYALGLACLKIISHMEAAQTKNFNSTHINETDSK